MTPKDRVINKKPQAGAKKASEEYVPPRITFTEIVVEEALMGICKGGTAPGPISTCDSSCMGGGS
jgi:hypothetical protein